MTQFPRINLNGTDGGVLAEEYIAGTNAVGDAIRALQAITVHGRDYHLISSQAGAIAHLEHAARISKLCAVRDELQAIALNVAQQNDERNRS